MPGRRSSSIRTRFGAQLRRLRTDQGLSQEAFADRAYLHRTYLGGVERGERNVSLDNIAKIAIALGVSLSELFSQLSARDE